MRQEMVEKPTKHAQGRHADLKKAGTEEKE